MQIWEKKKNDLDLFSGRQHILNLKTLIRKDAENFDSESAKFYITR